MKKLILLFFSLLLVSCSGAEYINPELPCNFTVTLESTGATFNAAVTEAECTIELTSGSMSGTSVIFSDSGSHATAGDFTREVRPETFPAQYAFWRAVKTFSTSHGQKTENENALKYSLDEMEILVYYGQESRRPERIETSERGKRFVFTANADL